MKTAAAFGLLLAASHALLAQGRSATRPVMHSASGQFVIFDRRDSSVTALPGPGTDKNSFLLEPAFLTVSCERIKSALYSELGAPNQWRGKIQVSIVPFRREADDCSISADRFRDGWQYQVNLPERVEQTMFVRTLVEAILLEMANRNAAGRSAEVPFWLVEGLTQQLLIVRKAEMILAPPNLSFGGVNIRPLMIPRRDTDPLEAARQVLRDRPPLTIEELSWPKPEEFAGAKGEAFRCSAQLFVSELLRLDNGRDCLRETVNGLGGCYNWQTAFLHAFHEEFPNQLALEKWWALQVTFFVGRNPQQLWTDEESWSKLDEVLHTPVAIRRTSGELPGRADVTMQAIIREWDTVRQLATLRSKVRELELIRLRVAPEFMALTDDYRRVLKDYLHQRERTTAIYANLQSMPNGEKKIALETIRTLDELDGNRESLRPRSPDSWSAIPPPSPVRPR